MLNPTSPSEQLAFSTVRILTTSSDGKAGSGTGFFYRFCDTGDRHVPAIVTNKHVFEGADRAAFVLHTADAQGAPRPQAHVTINMQQVQPALVHHPDPNVDLCVMPIASLHQQLEAQGNRLFYKSLDKSFIPTENDLAELTTVEDVIMIGYPIGIADLHNNMPVVRRGITATHPALQYQGRSEFMIDAACFPGSSGSPILLFNIGTYSGKQGNPVIGTRIKLLGVLYGGPQYTAQGEIKVVSVPTAVAPVAATRIPTNLGIAVKASKLLDFEDIFARRLSSSQVT